MPDGTVVWITLAEVRGWTGGRAVLTFEAPASVTIMREEAIAPAPPTVQSSREDDGELE